MISQGSLQALLQRPGIATVVGAHDALTAKLIEDAGFDAVWAGGFGISASQKCAPDASGLTMTESLDVARNIAEAISIPVIADCDTGYGNAINVMRTVAEFEKAGIAGICIEDNVYPKRCSFYAGVTRELVTIDEFVGKIRAAKSSQATPGFAVIARTEALIAGWGMQEAISRASAYAAAGADAILVHSKCPTFDELHEFASTWTHRKPLVIVPTTFPQVTEDELEKAGFKMVIYANQPLRAAINATRAMLVRLKHERTTSHVSEHIASLQEVYDLVGVSKLTADEQLFLPVGAENVTAIVIAAGFEKHLLPLTQDRPKCLLDIKGRTILEHQVAALNSCNIKNIAVVRGYLKEKITFPNLRYYDNDHYEETGELFSLFCAESELHGRVIVLYSDIVFEPAIVQKLLRCRADIVLVVDQAWYDHHRQGLPHPHFRPDLVSLQSPPQDGYRFVPDENVSQVTSIGQHVPPDQSHGEFIGMAMFSERGTELLREAYRNAGSHARERTFHEAPSLRQAALTDMIQELIASGHEVACVRIYKGWMEVDTFEDYQRAWATLKDGQ